MGFFGKKNVKKEEQLTNIRVLGPGCNNCVTLEKVVKTALENLGINEEVSHVTDYNDIISYGVMNMPALYVDGKIVSQGKVLTVEEAEAIIKEQRA